MKTLLGVSLQQGNESIPWGGMIPYWNLVGAVEAAGGGVDPVGEVCRGRECMQNTHSMAG